MQNFFLIPEVKIQHKITQIRNKTCTKHYFVFILKFYLVTLPDFLHACGIMPVQIETFEGKLFSGIFCNSKNDFFDIT